MGQQQCCPFFVRPMRYQSLLNIAVFIWLPLLLVAAVADVFSEEMNWGWEDYVAATLFLSAGTILFSWIRRVVADRLRQSVLLAAACCMLALLWALLAVGF
ncbi:MAG: hypothetical protein RLZZ370_248 [Bacteroidota bacterium]|jgi:hypothetical protein